VRTPSSGLATGSLQHGQRRRDRALRVHAQRGNAGVLFVEQQFLEEHRRLAVDTARHRVRPQPVGRGHDVGGLRGRGPEAPLRHVLEDGHGPLVAGV
jgi:hypothetical protein